MDAPVSLEAETQEVVVLGDDLAGRAREIDLEDGHIAAQVIHLEDQVIRQVRVLAPDDPADTQRRQAELMSGGVDGLHAREDGNPTASRAG